MKENKYNRSFATRLSRWLISVLLIMVGGMSFVLYSFIRDALIQISANNFNVSMRSSDRAINNVMSNVDVAVRNNLFDIERHMNEPEQMQAIMERIVAQNPRIHRCNIRFVDDNMQVADSAYWSEPFFDGQDAKTPLVGYMYPIHDAQGRVVAVLGADLSLDFMTQILQEQDSLIEKENWMMSGFLQSYALSRNGMYITHPDHRRILRGDFYLHVKDADESGLAERIVNEIKERKLSDHEVDKVMLVNRKESYVFYSPLTDTDWMLVTTVPTGVLDLFGIMVGVAILLVIIVVLMVTFLVCYLIIKRTTKPLKQLANAADKVAQGEFDTLLPIIRQRDEICQLRDSFENMQYSLTEYMENLKASTSEKASIENELKIAHGIQMSMLPKTYPAFPDRDDIDIFGMVTPAKAVGGDLYDFFIRDEKLFFCIGDVSGKGVPASLVMAVTRSLFRNISAYTAAPDQIVLALNEALSSNNETGMFVTLFLGVLDLGSGQLCYTNAGHNVPLLITPVGINSLTCDANIPAGVMPGWQFTVQEQLLKPGDSVFLYTDGLNEAENNSHEQFEMERVQQVASRTINQPQPLIEAMTDAVQLFVGDAEQSDDLTMLAIQYTNSISPTTTK